MALPFFGVWSGLGLWAQDVLVGRCRLDTVGTPPGRGRNMIITATAIPTPSAGWMGQTDAGMYYSFQ
jgi:hypothetical protein